MVRLSFLLLMVMLRNKSRRAVSSKQILMADNTSSFSSSPTQNHTNSPRFLNGLLARSLSDVDTGISPKSILDNTQIFNNLGNPFGYDRNSAKSITYIDKKHSTLDEDLELEGIKLALMDTISKEESFSTCSKANCRMILFGTDLKVQSDFGIKSRESQFLASSVNEEKDISRNFAEYGLSLKEMESSEDYTCVITHGPNPKTTHIFDNCIVDEIDSCCVFGNLSEFKIENQCDQCYDGCSCNFDFPQGKDNMYMQSRR